jgi:hypothetical protein
LPYAAQAGSADADSAETGDASLLCAVPDPTLVLRADFHAGRLITRAGARPGASRAAL